MRSPTKALSVLRDEIDEALQPLCLSVVGSDTTSQAQLARAAQDIASRLSSSDATRLRREASAIRGQRQNTLAEVEVLKRQLRAARYSEIEAIVIGGESFSPIDAAKRVKTGKAPDGWIPGPLHGALCPLSNEEVHRLYASQGVISAADETHLAVSQPTREKLVSEADFLARAMEQRNAGATAAAHQPQYWEETAAAEIPAMSLAQLYERVRATAAMLAEEKQWLREVLFAGWTGGDNRDTWLDLLKSIDELVEVAAEDTRLITKHGPQLVQDSLDEDELVATLSQIVCFVEDGGEFGLKTRVFHSRWHQLFDASTVGGRRPRTLDEFRALHSAARLPLTRRRFKDYWGRAIQQHGGPTADSLGDFPERLAQAYAGQIRELLDWKNEKWEPLIEEVRAAGFRWEHWLGSYPPQPGVHGEFERVRSAVSEQLASVINAKAALVRQEELSGALQEQRTYLEEFSQSTISARLLAAQDVWDEEEYTTVCRLLARLDGLRNAYRDRLALLDKLRESAPSWLRRIDHRQPPHDQKEPPGDPAKAWLWTQLYQELEKRAAVSLADLNDRLEDTQKDLPQLAAKIVELETWAAQKERTKLPQQMALVGFVQTLRKIGRGTGKRAPALMRKARELLVAARSAVPVWIMPLARVYETFDPREKKFNVVIIDEASQSDVTALAALYLGKEHVVDEFHAIPK